MGTSLLLAVGALVTLIAVPASRDLFNAARQRSERDAKQRLVPIRIDDERTRRQRDSRDR
jgi:hypothetical protein